MCVQKKKGRFICKFDEPEVSGSFPKDHIQTYLKEPLVSPAVISDAGGYLKYWHAAINNRPSLAKMGTDFCSTPGEYLFYYLLFYAPNLWAYDSFIC